MSRSERTDLPNPAKLFLEWSAEKGVLQYYDKETKTNIEMKLPFSFMVLDEVSQIGGGTKRNGIFSGFWSNAVKNLKTQEIIVKSKEGVEARGLYADIKDKKGFNYIKGLYIAYYDEKVLTIGFLKFKGSSTGAWFDYTKVNRDIYAGSITIKKRSDVIHGEKGDYYTPVLVHNPNITEESETAALELDKGLQEYLRRYFAMQGIEQAENEYTGHREDIQMNEPPLGDFQNQPEPEFADDLEVAF
jgi:hypothetical protein